MHNGRNDTNLDPIWDMTKRETKKTLARHHDERLPIGTPNW
jgi:hypothetical protein